MLSQSLRFQILMQYTCPSMKFVILTLVRDKLKLLELFNYALFLVDILNLSYFSKENSTFFARLYLRVRLYWK